MKMSVSRFRKAAAALPLFLISCGPALALEGVPPFEWFAYGPMTPELHLNVSVSPVFGLSGSFAGDDEERQLQVSEYLVMPLLLRYGIWRGVEIYGAFPFYWGRSSQRCAVYIMGYPYDLAGTVSGQDFGDAALGVRLRTWSQEFADSALLAGIALVPPLGTNVWQGVRYSFQTLLEVPEELAMGDGAWKIAFSLQHFYGSGAFSLECLAGYLLKLPFEVTGMGLGYGSTVEAKLPSPIIFVGRPGYEIWPGLSITGNLAGYWAPEGELEPGGYLAAEPERLPLVLGSYMNLAESSGALWGGAGLRWVPSEEYELGLDVMAPVLAQRAYRTWRVGLSANYLWSPR